MSEFFGMYKGLVTNNADPEGLGRVKAVVPQVFGDTVTESDWAWPCFQPGYTTLPLPGQGVWVSFEGGDEDYPIWMGMWTLQPGLAAFDPSGAAAAAQANAEAYAQGLVNALPPPFYLANVIPSPSPATIASTLSNDYLVTSFTLPFAATVRAMVQVTWSLTVNQYQGFSVNPRVDGGTMTSNGISSQNSGTSVGTPQYVSNGFGSGHYAAGTHTLSAFCQVGGTSQTITVIRIYGDIQVVGP